MLGGFVADLARRCDIMFPEGDTTIFGFDCTGGDLGAVGEVAFPSVGVGGVMKVVGASTRLGGVAGRLAVTIRWGGGALGDELDGDCLPMTICGGEAGRGSSTALASRFFPPNSEPIPPLVLGLAVSVSAPALEATGAVDFRLGANASLSFPTGDTPRLATGTSPVLALRPLTSWVDAREFTSVALAESVESSVSEAIRGDQSVRRPACD